MNNFETDFAVLSEHRRWRFTVFLALYVAQGIPYGLIIIALPAYMVQQGIDALRISAFVGLCMLPHAIKMVNGPIMDRWTYWPMGKRRPWVLIAQGIIVVLFVSLSLIPDPLDNLPVLTVACFALNFFVGFQDVATDGMAVDVLPIEDQPKASSIMFGGTVLAGAIAAAAGSWALSNYGLGVPSIVSAITIVLISCFVLISRERVGERLLPWTEGRATVDPLVRRPENLKEIGLNLKKFMLLRACLFAIAASAIYQFGRGIFLTMMPLYFVNELGWTDTEYSGLTGTAMLVGGAISMLFGGLLLDYFGRTRAFQILCAVVAGLGVILAVAPELGDSDLIMKIYRLVYMTLDTLVIVAFIAVAMAVCAREIAATQFALFMALGNVGFAAGSAAFGPLNAVLPSYEAIFFIFVAVTITAIFAMAAVSIEDHTDGVQRLRADSPPIT